MSPARLHRDELWLPREPSPPLRRLRRTGRRFRAEGVNELRAEVCVGFRQPLFRRKVRQITVLSKPAGYPRLVGTRTGRPRRLGCGCRGKGGSRILLCRPWLCSRQARVIRIPAQEGGQRRIIPSPLVKLRHLARQFCRQLAEHCRRNLLRFYCPGRCIQLFTVWLRRRSRRKDERARSRIAGTDETFDREVVDLLRELVGVWIVALWWR